MSEDSEDNLVNLKDFFYNDVALLIERVEVKKKCYFCGWDKTIHIHHIIMKKHGGLDEDENLVDLCPNHHSMIHQKNYYIHYTKGILVLVNRDNTQEKIYPSISNKEMELPELSIVNGINKKMLKREWDING